jgi:hypothetical protein
MLAEHDIKTGKEMLKEAFIQKNPEWHRVGGRGQGLWMLCTCETSVY